MPDGKKIWKILRKRNYGLLVKIVSWLNTYNGCYRNIPHYTTQTQRPYTLMVIMLVTLLFYMGIRYLTALWLVAMFNRGSKHCNGKFSMFLSILLSHTCCFILVLFPKY